MNFKDLSYFVTLAEYQHFRKAADACQISQPTLSIQLKKIEKELGVALYERNKTPVALTGIGHRLVEQAKLILAEYHTLQKLAASQQQPAFFPSSLRIGLPVSLAAYWLPIVLPLIKKVLPETNCLIYEANSMSLLKQLREKTLDIVFLSLPVVEESLNNKKLFSESFFVLLPHTHRLKNEKNITLSTLQKERWLLMEEAHPLGQAFSAFIAKTSFTQQKANHRITHPETLRLLVSSGFGVTLLPLLAFKEDDGSTISKALVAPVLERTASLLWHKKNSLGLFFERLGELITSEINMMLPELAKKLQ